MRCEIKDNKVLVYATFQEREIVKAIGGYKWSNPLSCWEFPLTSLISIIEKLRIDYGQDIKDAYATAKFEQKELEKKYGLAEEIKKGKVDEEKYAGLFQHQKQALQLARLFPGYLFAMEMGTAKTRCAVHLIEERKVPTLVLAPLATLESVWTEEIEKWSSLSHVNLWHNLDAFNKDYNIYISNYEHFKLLAEKEKIENKIKFIIIDESSKMKNPRSAITKIVLSYKDKIPYRLLLSGQPAPNTLLEYWAQMEFVNPNLFD